MQVACLERAVKQLVAVLILSSLQDRMVYAYDKYPGRRDIKEYTKFIDTKVEKCFIDTKRFTDVSYTHVQCELNCSYQTNSDDQNTK